MLLSNQKTMSAFPTKGTRMSRISPWWRDTLLAAFIWGSIIYINTPLITTYPPPALVAPFFDAEHTLQRWTMYSFVLVLIALWLRLRTFWFAIYFWAFPFVFPVLVLWYVVSTLLTMAGWEMVVVVIGSLVSASLRAAGTARTAAIAIAILPSCYLMIGIATNKYILIAMIFLLLFGSLRIVWGAFRWSLGPLDSFLWILDRIVFYNNKDAKTELLKVFSSKDPKGEKIKKAHQKIGTRRSFEGTLRRAALVLTSERNLLAMFISVLLSALLLTTVSFGFLYFGLYKVNSAYFTSTPPTDGIGEFLYFSLMVMSTSDLSSIRPASSLAKILTVVQLMCALALLSLLLLVFSTVGRSKIKEARSTVDSLITSSAKTTAELEAIIGQKQLEAKSDT